MQMKFIPPALKRHNHLAITYFKPIILSLTILALSGCSSGTHVAEKTSTTSVQSQSQSEVQVIATTRADLAVEPSIDPPRLTLDADGVFLGATPEKVIEHLGLPEDQHHGMAITEQDYSAGDYKRDRLFYANGKLILSKIESSDIAAPQGLQVGQSISSAFKLYGIPDPLKKHNIKLEEGNLKVLEALKGNDIGEILFDYKDIATIKVDFDLDRGLIQEIVVSKGRPKEGLVQIVEEDFSLDLQGLLDKFGYPYLIGVPTEDSNSVILGYEQESPIQAGGAIVILNNSKEPMNVFTCRSNWITPDDIKKGDDLDQVLNVHKLGKAETLIKDQGFRISNLLYNFGLRNGSKKPLIEWLVCQKMNIDGLLKDMAFKDPVSPVKYTIQNFDAEAMVSDADFKMSNIEMWSSREDVFKVLGKPIEIESGYDDYASNYQACTFEFGNAYFVSVNDFGNLKEGSLNDIYITKPGATGLRGVKVGAPIEDILKVIPGSNTIDFKGIKENTVIYEGKLLKDGEYSVAKVEPDSSKNYSGLVRFEVDWYKQMYLMYENGIITAVGMYYMLD